MWIARRRLWGGTTALLLVIVLSALTVIAYRKALESPPNFVWSLFSGYYRYDPRRQAPPPGLMSERPEDSLKYFFDATLKLCGGSYPPLSHVRVTHYEVEEVEYLGHSDYHAASLLHTRVAFADGTSIRAVFQFEAGHNEWDSLPFVQGSIVRARGWMSIGSFIRDPDTPPPGWSRYQENERPFTCTPGPPYRIESVQQIPKS
jgi:hypothetical protein